MMKNIVQLKNYISEYCVRNKNDESIPVYSVTNDMGFCTDYFNKEVASKDKTTYKIVPRGFFAYNPSRINVGSVDWQRQEDRVIVSPLYVVFKVSPMLDQQYLLYYLKSEITLNYIRAYATGSVRDNLKFRTLQEFPINLCSIEEQRDIVKKLDFVDSLITARREQLAKLDELVKSRFIEMFGTTGKQVPLTEYVWFQEGPGVRSVDFVDEGTILLTGSNINDNAISFGHKSDRHISEELATGKYAHFMCDKDDILVVSSAIDPDKFDKKVVLVDVDDKYCLNTGIIRFKPNKQYLTIGYFREFLKTDYFKRQVSSEMRGIAQMHFGPSHLKQMTILLPDSIERQVEFEVFVQQTDKSKFEIQKSLEKLETLKKALMQKYFG